MATTSARKPASVVYGVDEAPPIGITLLSGLQHIGIISIALVHPLIIARAAQLSVSGGLLAIRLNNVLGMRRTQETSR